MRETHHTHARTRMGVGDDDGDDDDDIHAIVSISGIGGSDRALSAMKTAPHHPLIFT